MRLPARGFAFLTVTALCWGCNWPVMKALMQDWPPYGFRILAGAMAISLLFLIAWWQGDALWPRPGQWRRLALFGLLNISSWSIVAPLSLFWLNASEAAIIAYTMPVWAILFAWPVLGEKPTLPRLGALLLGIAGVGLLLGGQLDGGLAQKWPGVLAILTTALMFAAGTVATKRWPLQMPQVPQIAWQLVLGLSPVVPISLLFERIAFDRITWLGWGCLIYVALFAQVLAYLAWFRALRLLPAGTAAIGSLLVPVIGVLASALLLGEPVGARQMAALALTLSGVVLAARG